MKSFMPTAATKMKYPLHLWGEKEKKKSEMSKRLKKRSLLMIVQA